MSTPLSCLFGLKVARAFDIRRQAAPLFLAALLAPVGVPAIAMADQPFQSLDAIRAVAERYVRGRMQNIETSDSKTSITAGTLDARLKLAPCTGKLSPFTLNGAPIAARTSIGVRCDGDVHWTVYVPVTIESDIDVLVLRNSLAREAHISGDDIDTQRRHVSGFGEAYINNLDAVREQHLKYSVPAGAVLRADMFARDFVVKRGQQVTLVVNASGLAVQAPGIALADGGTSDRIRVQNQSSLKVVEGVVESGNLVRVGM